MLSWKLSKIPVMFLILSMLMICAAHGSESDENNTLTLIGGCTINSFNTSDYCNLVPEPLVKGKYRIKLHNVNVESGFFGGILQEYMFGEYLENITYLEISSKNCSDQSNPENPIVGINDYAFRRLKSLEELHIHLDTLRTLDSYTFDGIRILKTLNMNGCKNLITDFPLALKKYYLPLVENLYISGIDSVNWYKLTLIIKQLRKLDISSTRIIFDPDLLSALQTSLTTLEYLNISGTQIRFSDGSDATLLLPLAYPFLLSGCSNLTHLDMSHISVQHNLAIQSKYLKVLNISGIFKTAKPIDDVEVALLSNDMNVYLSYVQLSVNRKLFIKLQCRNLSIEVVELSENVLEYIAPNALACFKFACTINLSRNKLSMMTKRSPDQFATLFRSLMHLENIRLSRNELTEIPASLFESNTNLRNIDLSSNKLQTINLSLDHLYHLSVLDLQNNEITVLDGASISVIDKLSRGSVVNLNSNPLDCSKCADLSFVSWLVESKQLKHEGLTCLRSKKSNYDVHNALVSVQMMCDKEITLRLSISILIAFLVLLSIILLIFYCRKRQIRKINRQREIEDIKMIMRENGKFAVFLTYSSKDDEFVKQYVIDNLNQNLKDVIGTDRNLVCEGDRYFRLGKPVMDEMSELLDRSAVLVALLSNNYCNSVFCRNEFQLAIYKEMPIILMLKEIVDPKNMSPSMRDMFEKKTRVLWEYENGEYKLKTTWLNVCQSVVEMIDIRKLGV